MEKINLMKALICINLHSSCCLFSAFLPHFLLVRIKGAASHCNIFSMQLGENTYTSQTVARKTKWRELRIKEEIG